MTNLHNPLPTALQATRRPNPAIPRRREPPGPLLRHRVFSLAETRHQGTHGRQLSCKYRRRIPVITGAIGVANRYILNRNGLVEDKFAAWPRVCIATGCMLLTKTTLRRLILLCSALWRGEQSRKILHEMLQPTIKPMPVVQALFQEAALFLLIDRKRTIIIINRTIRD